MPHASSRLAGLRHDKSSRCRADGRALLHALGLGQCTGVAGGAAPRQPRASPERRRSTCACWKQQQRRDHAAERRVPGSSKLQHMGPGIVAQGRMPVHPSRAVGSGVDLPPDLGPPGSAQAAVSDASRASILLLSDTKSSVLQSAAAKRCRCSPLYSLAYGKGRGRGIGGGELPIGGGESPIGGGELPLVKGVKTGAAQCASLGAARHPRSRVLFPPPIPRTARWL